MTDRRLSVRIRHHGGVKEWRERLSDSLRTAVWETTQKSAEDLTGVNRNVIDETEVCAPKNLRRETHSERGLLILGLRFDCPRNQQREMTRDPIRSFGVCKIP